jgi:DNA primase
MNDFQIVKEKLNILDYARQLTHMKKAGRKYVGLCPLHSEKSPSFTVDHVKQLFYCHGCGQGGDIITLYQLVENIDEYGALEGLAEKHDIPLQTIDEEGYKRRKGFQKKQKDLVTAANNHIKVKEASDYIFNRGINQESVNRFMIGYGKKNHSIVIPLLNHRGMEIGYCERFIGDPPKGFNSKYRLPSENPESEIYNELFKKGDFLFNEHNARKALKKDQYLLVFEGQFDTIAADQIGFNAAVACMQSSLTNEQAKRIAKLAENNTVIVLVPDLNDSGMNSIEINYHLIKSIDPTIPIKVLLLPLELKDGKEMDFNDHVCKKMTREQAETYIIYAEIGLLKVMMNKTKDALLQQEYAKEIVEKTTSPFVKENICDFLAETWGMDKTKVEKFFSVKSQTTLYEHFKTIQDMRNDFMDRIYQSDQNNIRTGYATLDKHLNNGLGVPSGWVLTFLARSSVGKTAFALNLIDRAVQNHGVGCTFFSFEQHGADIYPKLAAIRENHTQKRVYYEYGNFNHTLYDEKLYKSYDKKLLTFDHQKLTISEIEELIYLADERFFDEVPCKIIIIDYLGYIKLMGRNRYEEMSELTGEIKQIAKRTNKLFVLLSQTSRKGGDGSQPVSFEDARDSGTIEENADILLAAYRPDLKKDLDSKELITVLDDYHIQILKNRNGPIGIDALLKFDKEKQIIREWGENEKKTFSSLLFDKMVNFGDADERVKYLREGRFLK